MGVQIVTDTKRRLKKPKSHCWTLCSSKNASQAIPHSQTFTYITHQRTRNIVHSLFQGFLPGGNVVVSTPGWRCRTRVVGLPATRRPRGREQRVTPARLEEEAHQVPVRLIQPRCPAVAGVLTRRPITTATTASQHPDGSAATTNSVKAAGQATRTTKAAC